MSAKHFPKDTRPGIRERISAAPKGLKRTLALLCSAAVVAAGVPAVALSVNAGVQVTAKTTAYLNLRKGPGTDYPVIMTMPTGTEVTAKNRINPGWLYVKLKDGTLGYCSSEYLDILTDCVTTDYVNLRVSHSTSTPVICTIPKGTVLDIIDFYGKSWAYIKASSGVKGYVCTDYTTYIDSSSNLVPTNTSSQTPGQSSQTSPAKSTSTSGSTSGSKTGSTVTSGATVKLSQSNVTMQVGTNLSLTATASSGGSITWTTSDKSVAYVENSGKVYALKQGTAVIAAKDKKTGVYADCTVKVVKPGFKGLSVPDSKVILNDGDSYTVVPTTDPAGNESKVKYKSSNTSVATVSSKGVVKAVGAGSATVTCYDSSETVTAKIAVTVNAAAAAELTISGRSSTIATGKTLQLTATTNSSGTIKWSTSDSSVATVTSAGKVKGVKAGTATITAKDPLTNQKITCKITVKDPDFTAITVSPTSVSIMVGKTSTITPKTTPADKTDSVKYKSSDTSVATVTSAGIIKGVKAGSATVTCSDSTGTVKAKVKVTVTGNTPSISISKTSASVSVGSSIALTAALSDKSDVDWTTSANGVASVRNGIVSGLSAGTAVITASDSTGKVTASCTVTVKAVSTGSFGISRFSASSNVGKTLYIKGYGKNGTWTSSDTNIATVREGFVYANAPGKVAISYGDPNGSKAVCIVTVSTADAIKFTYSSPNSATVNSVVKLIAITDKNRTNVRFTVVENGYRETIYADEKKTDGNTYVWTASYRVTSAGQHNYIAYGYNGTAWSTCENGKADIWVTDKSDPTQTGLDRLRASDEVIQFIGSWEGFVSDITYDVIANNIPTIAHGYVVWEGQNFYDHLTRNEGYALLVKAVNTDSYSSRVNDMLIGEGILFNQQQFDSLVSFSYNLGTGWSYGSSLKNILLNSYGPSMSSGTVYGTVNANGGLNLRKSYTTASDVIRVLKDGEKVTLVSTTKYNGVWYKVKTSTGETGYCSGTYLNLTSTGATVRDLTYVNKNALITEMLAYHHAGGGICYYGLLYRRADELEMYFYGDYAPDGRSNKYGFPNPSCISFP